MSKAPAFQFYAADFLVGTFDLTAEEVGAYVRLLAFSWDKGPLPLDLTKLAAMAGLSPRNFKKTWEKVGEKWEKTPEGWVNDRLEKQRRDREAFSRKASKAGQKSGIVRREQRTTVERPLNDRSSGVQLESNSSVFSLQSSKDQDQEHTAPAALVQAWNTGTTAPIPHCRDLSPKRRTKAQARLTEANLDAWTEVVARIEASDFCRGGGAAGWVATFDWLLRPDTRLKVLEGQYDNRKGTAFHAQPAPSMAWTDECDQHHGGTCQSQWAHTLLMEKAS